MENKIKTQEEIKRIVDKIRNEKTIVTTCGAFDILHLGHIKSFREAKSLGDILIVCLNSDTSIKEYKSKDRPINKQNIRLKNLSNLEFIDYVVIFNETDPRNILEMIKPHKHVKSKSGFKGIERDTVKKNGGEIILVEDLPGYSTTKIIEKLKKG